MWLVFCTIPYLERIKDMRRYAYLKSPIQCNKKDRIYKIMLYTVNDGVYLFEYCSSDALMCSFDSFYEDINDLYEVWNNEIDERGWIDIDDPLPDCQHDAFLPIRVKGRNTGKPEWGEYEIFEDGVWRNYIP